MKLNKKVASAINFAVDSVASILKTTLRFILHYLPCTGLIYVGAMLFALYLYYTSANVPHSVTLSLKYGGIIYIACFFYTLLVLIMDNIKDRWTCWTDLTFTKCLCMSLIWPLGWILVEKDIDKGPGGGTALAINSTCDLLEVVIALFCCPFIWGWHLFRQIRELGAQEKQAQLMSQGKSQ